MASNDRSLISTPTTHSQYLLAPEALTEDERRQVEVIQMKTALDDTPLNGSAGLVAGLALAFLDWHSAVGDLQQAIPWVWSACYAVVTLRGIWGTYRFKRGPQTAEAVLAITRRLAPWAASAGLLWGCCPWFMLPTADSKFELLLIIVNAMWLMGVAVSKATHRATLLQMMVPASVLFVLGLMRLADEFHVLMGCAFAVFTMVLLSFSKVQERSLKTSIQLRFHAEKLLKERIAQQREADLARQEAEVAKEQAEMANHGKTTFLTAAGHDLRQPMHALVQYFGHLKRRNRDPQLDDTIVRIGQSLDSMQDLLDTILEVSKLMMGSVKPSLSTFEISPLLDRLDSQLRPIAEDKGLVLRVSGNAAMVHTDQVMLERILRNLALNAIRYTDSGQVLVRARSRGTRLVLQVFDTGIGIGRTEREKIFEAFYQVGNEARDRRRGLGLGLAIVRQLSELLGIKVQVQSREGRGSVFRVELQTASDRSGIERVRLPQNRQDFAWGAFVVLIDDNEESLEATAASLKEFGCRVLSAHSGMQAIERLQRQEFMPQLVIADYRLEGETGLEAIKMVVDNQQALYGDELDISAFIVSGDTAPAQMQLVADAGYRMLHKPVRLDALYEVVNTQLEIVARDETAGGRA